MMLKLCMAATVMPENMRVAMICFAAGILLLVIGRLVWKNVKPEYLPGYKKVDNEDTKTFARLAGQAHMLWGVGLILMSVPLNEQNPNVYFAMVMTVGCFIFVILGAVRYVKAMKMRRKK